MQPLVLRTKSSLGLCVAIWIMVAIGLVSMAVQGYWTAMLHYGPLFLVAAWGVWMLFGAPAVRIDDDAVTLDNVGRSVRIPWNAVVDVEAGISLSVVTAAGRFSAWAAPGGNGAPPTAVLGAEQQLSMGNIAAWQIAGADNRQQMDAILGIDPSGRSTASTIRTAIQQAWRSYGAVNALIAEPTGISITWHRKRLAVLGLLVVLAVVGIAV